METTCAARAGDPNPNPNPNPNPHQVRGKSGFAVTHMELVRAASLWGKQRGLEGRLVVCIDHGSAPDAWYL